MVEIVGLGATKCITFLLRAEFSRIPGAKAICITHRSATQLNLIVIQFPHCYAGFSAWNMQHITQPMAQTYFLWRLSIRFLFSSRNMYQNKVAKICKFFLQLKKKKRYVTILYVYIWITRVHLKTEFKKWNNFIFLCFPSVPKILFLVFS